MIDEVQYLRDGLKERDAEIERLRAGYRRLVEWYDRQNGTPCEQIRHQQELEEQRNAAIEECARVAEAECYDHDDSIRVAAAIRALKS